MLLKVNVKEINTHKNTAAKPSGLTLEKTLMYIIFSASKPCRVEYYKNECDVSFLGTFKSSHGRQAVSLFRRGM